MGKREKTVGTPSRSTRGKEYRWLFGCERALEKRVATSSEKRIPRAHRRREKKD